jgi:PAS domain S-box-containing protein
MGATRGRRAATRGEAQSVRTTIDRVFWIGVTGLLLAAAIVTGVVLWDQRTREPTVRTRELARLAREVEKLAVDREAGLRGYLLSGDSATLAPELAARALLRARVDSLVAMTFDDIEQRERAVRLRDELAGWERDFAAPILAASPAAARTLGARQPDAAAWQRRFEPVRATAAAFTVAEEERYRLRTQRRRGLMTSVAAATVVALIGGIITLGWLRRRLIDHMDRLTDQQDQLEQQATELEEQALELEQQVQETHSALEELTLSQAEAEQLSRDQAETLALLDLVLGSAPIGIAFQDRDHRLIRVNAAFTAIDGKTPDQVLGRPIGAALPEAAGMFQASLERVIATGEPVTNVEVARENGDVAGRRHWLIGVYPVRGTDGAVRGTGAIAMETTELKRLEGQLIQAQKLEAVGLLAGSVAHDFNNVLTAIATFSEFAIGEVPVGSAAYQDIEQIRFAATRAATLTRQLLAFSRRQVLQVRVVNLNEVVSGLGQMLRRLLGADIHFETLLDPDLGAVQADPGQIEQVIMNLAVNARDAMPAGGTLLIETRNVELDEETAREHLQLAAGHYAMLAASDTGVGMDAPTQARIFEPFFTTKEAGRGTGLGLSTVYGIVKQSGGAVRVYSELGRGTTFKIYLPRATVTAAPAPAPAADPRRPSEHATVLLVEDEPQVRIAARRTLERNGITVLEAENGRVALHVLEKYAGPLDLVITDMIMPGMGGRELTARVATLHPGVRVLYMSGYTADAANRQAILDNDDAFLEKPFTPDGLLRKVRDILAA